ncbi:MAG: hypothetical protein ACLTYN_16430 [Dysosmobacter welbionis]
MLVKQGFQGRIVATRLTADLMDIMRRDSAHIQESDAEWKNRKAERSGAPGGAPLHHRGRPAVSRYMTTCEYNQPLDLCEGVRVGSWTRAICWAPPPSSSPPRRAHHQTDRLFRRHRQCGPAHHPGPHLPHRRGLRGDGVHLRRPQPHEVWSYTDDLAKIIDEPSPRAATW